MTVEVFNAPEYNYSCSALDTIYPSIFLAGTIDNGNSTNWQAQVIDKLKNNYLNFEKFKYYEKLWIYNPRRDDWNSNAIYEEQRDQIIWEQYYLKDSDIIIMNLLPDSKSPISLMEIGLFASSVRLHVFCTPEFYRYTNVKVICNMYNVPVYETNDPDEIVKIIANQI